MSAICGIVNLEDRPVSTEISGALMDRLAMLPADASKVWNNGQVFMGCRHQWITPESQFETLPYYDETNGLCITADAIIDNRSELFSLLGIPPAQQAGVSDSGLILLAYRKWGHESPGYLNGDFAFAIWDGSRKELFCARDHVGKRTIYYFYDSRVFAFCTLMKPVFVLPQNPVRLIDLWIADFLAIPSVAHELDMNHTVYKDIMHLPPAHTLTISPAGIKKRKYWVPLQLPELRLKNDKEYDSAFREVFFEAVRCRTRSIGSVGIMLSGGLDSGAIACAASKYMGGYGETLQAFSALPMECYEGKLPGGLIADESEYIDVIAKCCENIRLTYCRSEGRNSLTDIERLLLLLEQPYKTVENLFWMDCIAKKAAEQNCKVLLDGQFGNSTISFGDFFINAYELVRKGRVVKLLNEITGYSRLYKISRKRFAMYVLKRLSPDIVREYFFGMKRKGSGQHTSSLVNPDLAEQYQTALRLEKARYFDSPYRNYTLNEVRRLTLDSATFTHMGAIETKLSLAYGIARRDPTRDKRVIDFCYRLPASQYVENGRERLLIRRSMEGILPDKVRLNWRVRGKQSADWVQRIMPQWSRIRDELGEAVRNDAIRRYVNVPEIEKALLGCHTLASGETNELELRSMLVFLIFNRFIENLDVF